jgi:cyclase
MRSALRLVVATLALTSFSLPSATSGQGRDMSQVQIIPHQVTQGVYYLEGQGGNIGLSIGEDGVVMIDDQFAPLTDRIVAAIRQLNQGEIRFVINTHVHGDHTGGNENLGRMGILILARDAVRVRLEATAPALALPVLTFSESISIHLNGEEVRTIPLPPAHTDGDSYIHFVNADVLHTGDVFRTTGYPYMDLANGGSLDGLIEALGIAIGLAGPNTKILPGHGRVVGRAEVIAHRDMVLDVKARVAALVAQGMNIDQILAARPTAQYDQGMDSPERFLRAMVTEMSGQ